MSDLREPEPSVQLKLDARPQSMPLLRRQLRGWLKPTATDRELFEIKLAAAEAFGNAIEHPKQPTSPMVEIQGTITDRTVTLSVRDHGRWQDKSSAKKEGGFGLTIIDEFMDSVAIEPTEDGTIVSTQRRLTSA